MIFWDRLTLKTRAKTVLRFSYWMTLLTLLVAGVLDGISFTVEGSTVGSGAAFGDFRGFGDGGIEVAFEVAFPPMVAAAVTVIGLLGIFYAIFVGNLITVGKCRYLTMCRYGEVNLGEIFFSFRDGRYANAMKTMFFYKLFIFLWSLLLVIPGIVKSYSYRMVPYIMAENPWISRERAFAISKTVTRGEKWRMFVLDLSFLGWILLCPLTCGIGVIFLSPYMAATDAELYGALRYKAVTTGLCSPEEIGKELFAR